MVVLRKVAKRILTPLLQRAHRLYFTTDRTYRIEKIKLKVLPGVFPPQFVFSSKILVKFLGTLDLKGKKFLDLGCGSGVIGIQAAKYGALVTAVDINEYAVINTKLNAENNDVLVYALQSDLFTEVKDKFFDYVFINPPYYPHNPKNNSEKAWYCGENHEYFSELFQQIKDRKELNGNIYMILSEDCARDKIANLAGHCGIEFRELQKVTNFWEANYIYNLN